LIGILVYPLLVVFTITWLLLCAVIALFSTLMPHFSQKIDLVEVRKRITVCKLLNQKGLISDSQYDFETTAVASQYDQVTFRGYLFICRPIIYIMQNSHWMDAFMNYMVQRWLLVHEFFLNSKARPSMIYLTITHLCIFLARGVGRALFFLRGAR
jgi:hypothetical protein